ncbi:PilZ domain-containing protein [Tautonia marina]|uniref:PilZ domain-containing protein n=1 Tax=Tautonia marina TaxID=2653855 RepID=UPI0012608C5B|nr:PilZ domain-containing protein [Tautonia marina]
MNPLRTLLGFPSKNSQRCRPEGRNRRQSIRYASEVPIELGWWEEDEFRSIDGTLLDISHGGAAVVLAPESILPEGNVHLRLADISESAWVAVEIRAVRPLKQGAKVAHLQFDGGCSYAFFRKALPATHLDSMGASYASGEFDTRSWR